MGTVAQICSRLEVSRGSLRDHIVRGHLNIAHWTMRYLLIFMAVIVLTTAQKKPTPKVVKPTPVGPGKSQADCEKKNTDDLECGIWTSNRCVPGKDADKKECNDKNYGAPISATSIMCQIFAFLFSVYIVLEFSVMGVPIHTFYNLLYSPYIII